MKIYVSEKENIDLSKKCYLTFSIKDKQTVDWNVLAQSLEQHEQEIRSQERLKVIAELEEWIAEPIGNGGTFTGYKVITNQLLKQKLKEMKGEK